jgi:hypothetical protein
MRTTVSPSKPAGSTTSSRVPKALVNVLDSAKGALSPAVVTLRGTTSPTIPVLIERVRAWRRQARLGASERGNRKGKRKISSRGAWDQRLSLWSESWEHEGVL